MTAESTIEATEKAEVVSDSEPTRPGPVFMPAVDIFETDSGITVLADMPGASPETIDIDLDNYSLTLSADVHHVGVGEETEVAAEWVSGRYHRQFQVPKRIDQDAIEATMDNGVLKVWLPRAEASKPRKIAVTA